MRRWRGRPSRQSALRVIDEASSARACSGTAGGHRRQGFPFGLAAVDCGARLPGYASYPAEDANRKPAPFKELIPRTHLRRI
jgi:hypothetical protein